MKHKALFECLYYADFKKYEITLYGYVDQSGHVTRFSNPVVQSGLDLNKARNKFLKRVKKFSIRSNVWMHFDWKIQTVRKRLESLGEQSMHWYRMDDSKWRNRHSTNIKLSDGRKMYRAELEASTCLHYSNCGLPQKRLNPHAYRWSESSDWSEKIAHLAI